MLERAGVLKVKRDNNSKPKTQKWWWLAAVTI